MLVTQGAGAIGAALLTAASGALAYYKSSGPRRRRLRKRPFPAEWEQILERNVALYRILPPTLRQELRGHMLVFLGEKTFEGCGGLALTDEIRVTVAALACILLVNRRARYYPGLTAILVYPAAYVVSAKRREGFIEFADAREIRLGESWSNGTLVLSWCDVLRTAHDVRDGHNLVLHEFAHQIDEEGYPLAEQRSKYLHWAEVMSQEYKHLVDVTSRGGKDVLQACYQDPTAPARFCEPGPQTQAAGAPFSRHHGATGFEAAQNLDDILADRVCEGPP